MKRVFLSLALLISSSSLIAGGGGLVNNAIMKVSNQSIVAEAHYSANGIVTLREGETGNFRRVISEAMAGKEITFTDDIGTRTITPTSVSIEEREVTGLLK